MASGKNTPEGAEGNRSGGRTGARADRPTPEHAPNLRDYPAHPSHGGAPFFLPTGDSPANWQVKPPLRGSAGSGLGVALAPDRPNAVGVAVAVLDKNTSKVSTPPALPASSGDPVQPRDASRKARYALREGLQAITTLPRVAKCGRCRVRESVDVLRGANGRAHYSGLSSCGSVWLCPVCAAKVDARRAEEVGGVLAKHLAAGGGAYFLTLTLPHHAGDRLARTRTLCARAFKRLLQGRAWQKLKALLGLVGTIRALEVTHGGNGWHPHLHVLLLTDAPLMAEQLAALDAYCFRTWREAVAAQGHAAPLRDGFRLERVADAEIGTYVTKMGVALELTHGAHKHGKKAEQRTPFQVLSDFLRWGDEADLSLWLEYEAAMKGARRLTWSRGLKARYAVDEVSDEELAAEEVGGVRVATISADEWRGVVAHGARLAVLEAAERDGLTGVSAVLAGLPVPAPPLRLAG